MMPTKLSSCALVGALLALPVSIGAQATSPRPPLPFADSAACPFEGCQYSSWRAVAPVTVHRSRSTSSPVAFRIGAGTTVTAVTGVVVTEAPGVVVFRDSVTLGTASGPIHVGQRDTLFLLTYEGEGSTTAWFKGRLYRSVDGAMAIFNGICESQPDRCVGRITVQPRTVWWVLVRDASGRTGWTSQPDRFAGKDALGSE